MTSDTPHGFIICCVGGTAVCDGGGVGDLIRLDGAAARWSLLGLALDAQAFAFSKRVIDGGSLSSSAVGVFFASPMRALCFEPQFM